jgi:hypothetical protein
MTNCKDIMIGRNAKLFMASEILCPQMCAEEYLKQN